MATILIRKLDESTKRRLRLRAVKNGRSMEEEARAILKSTLNADTSSRSNFVKEVRKRIEPVGGIVLPDLPRDPMRDPPDLG